MRRPKRPNNVLQFKARPNQSSNVVRANRKVGWRIYAFAVAAFSFVFLVGYGATNWLGQDATSSDESSVSQRFAVCGLSRRTCVVDGDTIWLSGTKIRIADIDTPEISEPQCDSEYARGIAARDRLIELLNAGRFEVMPIGTRDEDGYGRKLRVLVRDGRSLGDLLVSEGLARTWTGRREPWC